MAAIRGHDAGEVIRSLWSRDCERLCEQAICEIILESFQTRYGAGPHRDWGCRDVRRYSGHENSVLRSVDEGEQLMARLNVNGKTYDVDVGPDTPLLWAIRENIGLTGTKYGCGIAQCGACTVHIDGVPTRSCSFPASAAEGKQIVTIEGLASNGNLTKVQQAWINNDVPQCGYCQSGMIMAVSSLLKEKPKPTDADIDAAITNICRCGTYQQVRAAIHEAANA
jgi:isoquinoline 1-oxidoreductase subunit alpha